MRVLSKLVVAAIALGALTTTASAVTPITEGSVTLYDYTGLSGHPGPAAGETLVWNFNQVVNPIEDTAHFNYTGATFFGNVFSGTKQIAAPPAGDLSRYGAAEPAPFGTNAVFMANPGVVMTTLSINLGSLDTENTLQFYSGSTLMGTFDGSELAGALTGVADGNQVSDLTNGRFYFSFAAADDINKLVFSTTKPAFEFDNIAATFTSGVPEPATWTMLILGFGFVGFMMRNNRQKTAGVLA
ncbi:MAG TPA: PEPxxWA-CTERM sorting domain-containing protein [Rhizomicrobium sp.]|nr:PEPxxWA-CTERM sorting domain-containing protein [Rhizomicrobium sp.]